jgi:hypothetical protein
VISELYEELKLEDARRWRQQKVGAVRPFIVSIDLPWCRRTPKVARLQARAARQSAATLTSGKQIYVES